MERERPTATQGSIVSRSVIYIGRAAIYHGTMPCVRRFLPACVLKGMVPVELEPLPESTPRPEDAVCRICLEGSFDELVTGSEDTVLMQSQSVLRCFCKCRGSHAYVHQHCLQEWRSRKTINNKCELCYSPYSVRTVDLRNCKQSNLFHFALYGLSCAAAYHGHSAVMAMGTAACIKFAITTFN